MKKAILIILDGWGIGDGSASDAIAHSRVPFYLDLLGKYPHSTLLTFGEHVGLPEGQMGNSEVGHMNLGAGRVVYQELARINKEVREGKFRSHPALADTFRYCLDNKKPLHIMGLVSDGGVHSYTRHLEAICEAAAGAGLKNIFIHAFTDGRDTDPKSGLGYVRDMEKNVKASGACLASVCGRYYAMDRDKRWERVRLAYDMLVNGKGERFSSAEEAISASYKKEVTDEFIKPCIISDSRGDIHTIHEGDAVICFNFRTDRCREITTVLTQKDMPEHGMKNLKLHYVTMTRYDDTFRDVRVIFEKENLNRTLGEILSEAGKTQLRIAETEKYPHVTFFFNGGQETTYPGEDRILIPSPKVATYDLQPEMSAREVTAAVLPVIRKAATDFICLNFANPDMVGHTGIYKAVQKAVATVDDCLRQVVTEGIRAGYSFIILADHGNADYMINPDGSPNTAHSMNPVPCILIDKDLRKIRNGKLGDIAPTLLKILGIPIPAEMSGKILIN